MGNPIIDPHRELRAPPEEQGPREYVIAGDHATWISWLGGNLKERSRVTYLDTAEKAQALLDAGAPRGPLHRLPGWETSPVRELAERLEARPFRLDDPRD